MSSWVRISVRIIAILVVFGCFLQGVSAESREGGTKPPNILLVIVDTLGANQLKAFGEGTSSTPQVDALARSGVVFRHAYSTAPWTKPAIASIFSGQMPSVHKVRRIKDVFKPNIPNLAERLKALGYRTGGIVSHTLLAPVTGYARGFDSYEIVPFEGKINDAITSAQVSDAGLRFLNTVKGDPKSSFFLFLHYFDAHYNYKHHAEFDKTSWYTGKLTPGMTFSKFRRAFPTLTSDDVRFMHSLHQEEIAFIDQQLGRVISYLEKEQLLKDTVVVFTSDHGEEFGEHGGVGHGHSLYNEVIQVPLIVYAPTRFAPSQVMEPVSTMDIAPTLLELLSQAMNETTIQGQSLLPLLSNNHRPFNRSPIFMEVDYNSSFLGVLEGSKKLILNKATDAWELFNQVKDPREKTNIVDSSQEDFDRLKQLVIQFRDTYQKDAAKPEKFDPKKESQGLDKETIKQLESLGYL